MRGKINFFLFMLLLLAMASWVLAQPTTTTPDPFLCYRVKPAKGSEKFEPIPHLTLTDQFEGCAFSVLRPLLLCHPA